MQGSVQFRFFGKACHTVSYNCFLKEIERILEQDSDARVRMDNALLEFRKAVLGKIKV